MSNETNVLLIYIWEKNIRTIQLNTPSYRINIIMWENMNTNQKVSNHKLNL